MPGMNITRALSSEGTFSTVLFINTIAALGSESSLRPQTHIYLCMLSSSLLTYQKEFLFTGDGHSVSEKTSSGCCTFLEKWDNFQ